MAIAAAYARAHGGHLVQDTAVPGFEEAPRDIVLGYSTMAAEALEQMAALGAGGAHPHLPPVRRGLYGRGCGRLSGENL